MTSGRLAPVPTDRMLFSQYYIKYFYGKKLSTEYLLQYTWQSYWVSNISVFFILEWFIYIYIYIYTHVYIFVWVWNIWGKNISYGCSRIGYRGRYLGVNATIEQVSEEKYIARCFVMCTAHQIVFDWSNPVEWDGRVIFLDLWRWDR